MTMNCDCSDAGRKKPLKSIGNSCMCTRDGTTTNGHITKLTSNTAFAIILSPRHRAIDYLKKFTHADFKFYLANFIID